GAQALVVVWNLKFLWTLDVDFWMFHSPLPSLTPPNPAVTLRILCDGLQRHIESAPHGLSDEGRPRRPGAGAIEEMVRGEALRENPGPARWRTEVCAARRPAVRQRRRAHRHRAQQDSQGHHRQI